MESFDRVRRSGHRDWPGVTEGVWLSTVHSDSREIDLCSAVEEVRVPDFPIRNREYLYIR